MLGRLSGLDGIRPVRSLELKPYLAMRSTRTVPRPGPVPAPFAFGPCSSTGVTALGIAAGCAGLDARVGLTSDLSLVATVNPDFGQVEADERVLNLGTFETFFPEKRPFFLEGLDIFQPPFQVNIGGQYGGDAFQIFYSRRIGRGPPTDVPDGASTLYLPPARPVTTAFKLTGTLGAASVGLLTALEPAVDAQLLLRDGTRADQRVAEAQHTAMARARIAAGDHAVIGMIGTALDPLFARGARHAHAGGLDLWLFDGAREWNLQAQIVGSHITGGATSVERDGTVVGDGSAGTAAQLKLQKQGGAFTGFVNLDHLSPRFTTNDLGFMRRANLFRATAIANVRDVHPSERWQSANALLFATLVRNAAFEVTLQNLFGVESSVALNSFWNLAGGSFYGTASFDDRELRDGTPFERPRQYGAYLWVSSSPQKSVAGSLNSFAARYPDSDGGYFDAWLSGRFRPLPHLEAQLGIGYVRIAREYRQIRAATAPAEPTVVLDPATATLRDRLYLVAAQDAQSTSALLRGTYAFTPRLTLQAFAQIFAAGVSYGPAQRALAAPGRAPIRYADLSPALAQDQAPVSDGRFAGLNVNLILRWEWGLGSTLYLVYAHGTSNELELRSPGLNVGKELGALGQPGATHGDTLLLKIDLLRAL